MKEKVEKEMSEKLEKELKKKIRNQKIYQTTKLLITLEK